MKTLFASLSIATALAFGFTAPAQAIPDSYANVGTQNPITYTFTAAADGDIKAYFAVEENTAGFYNEIALWVNGVRRPTQGLGNSVSAYGDMINFGGVTAGDALVFELITLVPATGIGPWYSDPTLNSDKVNRIYSFAYAGDDVLPAGTVVAFEDLPLANTDFNYRDEVFLFTNIATVESSDVPEPASLALLLAGAAGFALRRRKARKA